MAADLPPTHQHPTHSPGTSTYSAQHASSLFDPFLHQSDPPLPPPTASAPVSTSVPRQLSPSAPITAHLTSAGSSSSLAGALRPQSPPLPARFKAHPTPAAGNHPKSPSPSGTHTPDKDGQSPSSEAKQSKAHLAADQPLTAHGKPRKRVYLACLQCRNRKVRCDGAKPECFNCIKRADPTAGTCSYDAAPRRRGKDRTPGSRRLAPLEPKKTRTTRSRIEEEQRRKKAEAAQAATRPSTFAPQVARGTSAHGPAAAVSPNDPDTQVELSGLESQASSAFTTTSSFPTIPHAPPATKHHRRRPVPAEPQIVTVTRPVRFNLNPVEFRDFQLTFAPPDAIAIARQLEEEEDLDAIDTVSTVSTPPGVQFTRETWWDALLMTYSAFPAAAIMTADMRDTTTQIIVSDLRFLFQNALPWFAFVNIPRFFARLWDPYHRQIVQPSLIYSALGLSMFFQSSELEKGAKGREKALQLVDQARAMFDASLSSGWIDIGLVQAAWFLAMFEMQAHPRSNTLRTRSAFKNLDSLIQSLSLTMLDISDPRTSVFLPGQVPVVPSATPISFSAAPPLFDYNNVAPGLAPPAVYLRQHGLVPGHSHAHSHTSPANYSQWQCGCSSYSLGNTWPLSVDLAPAWTCTPMWPDDANEGEMQKEECRRLVWSTLTLTASHNTKTTAGTDREPQHLWIKDPANYALLFPGESLAPLGTESIPFSKDSVWALNMRVLFLWQSSLRQRANISMSDADRAAYAMGAWLELDTVETCLDRHTCGIQSGYMMQMREILFNTRMVVSNEFKRYIPEATTSSGQLFYRERAERWMTFMLATARHFLQSFKGASSEPDRNNRRCFMMYWFMSQITRALSLWHADPSLGIALDVAKTFAPCVEYMMMIWPSPNQRREYEALRGWLVRSCMNAGVPAPERAIPFVPTPRPPSSLSQPRPDPIVTAGAYSYRTTQL